MKLDLFKQIVGTYKERIIDGLISWILVFGFLIGGFLVGRVAGLSPINLYVFVLLCFGGGLFINYNRLKSRTDFEFGKEFKSILLIFVIFTAMFWFNYLYGNVIWVFVVTTLVLVVWKIWRSKDFLGEQMAYIEILMFGKPQTKKWQKKMMELDEDEDKK